MLSAYLNKVESRLPLPEEAEGEEYFLTVTRDIDRFRFDTRWDFSVRVSIVLHSGKRIRLPDESLPPHRDLETLLNQAGIRVERHHFTVF